MGSSVGLTRSPLQFDRGGVSCSSGEVRAERM